jgi:hypothetical protein
MQCRVFTFKKKNFEGSVCQVIPEPTQHPSLNPAPAQFIQEAVVPDNIKCIAKITKKQQVQTCSLGLARHLVNSR